MGGGRGWWFGGEGKLNINETKSKYKSGKNIKHLYN
jgi:hypothetical protein